MIDTPIPSLRNALMCAATTLLLCACGSSEKVTFNAEGNVHKAIDAATGPLEDLNLKQRDIPTPLRKALVNPYARPEKAKCATVREELAQLDAILGADVKTMTPELASADPSFLGLADAEMPDTASLVDGVGDMAQDAVLGAIRSQTNILPFRGIVRKITGADRYQKKVERAYEAGKLRRAYLKGYAQDRFSKSCLAAPIVVEAKEEKPKEATEAKAPETQ